MQCLVGEPTFSPALAYIYHVSPRTGVRTIERSSRRPPSTANRMEDAGDGNAVERETEGDQQDRFVNAIVQSSAQPATPYVSRTSSQPVTPYISRASSSQPVTVTPYVSRVPNTGDSAGSGRSDHSGRTDNSGRSDGSGATDAMGSTGDTGYMYIQEGDSSSSASTTGVNASVEGAQIGASASHAHTHIDTADAEGADTPGTDGIDTDSERTTPEDNSTCMCIGYWCSSCS